MIEKKKSNQTAESKQTNNISKYFIKIQLNVKLIQGNFYSNFKLNIKKCLHFQPHCWVHDLGRMMHCWAHRAVMMDVIQILKYLLV